MAIEIAFAAFILIASVVTLFGYRRYVLAGRLYQNLQTTDGTETADAAAARPRASSVAGLAKAVAAKFPPPAKTIAARG